MLTRLHIKDFKSFKDEEIELSRTGLTVLVGPNGSGKSTVLEAAAEALRLDFVSRSDIAGEARPTHDEREAAPTPVERRTRSGASAFTLAACVELGDVFPGLQVEGRSEYRDGRILRHADAILGPMRTTFYPHQGIGPVDVEIGNARVLTDTLLRGLPAARYFAVEVNKLRAPLQPWDGAEPLEIDAEQVIKRMLDLKLGTDVRAFERLVDDVQNIVPAVRGIALQRSVSKNRVETYGLQFDTTTGTGIDGAQASEGTLLALALCVASRSKGHTLLLVDDIDRALHPVAQRQLVAHLRKVVSAQSMQVICTTHSPYVLGEFKYEEVRVLREVDGASRCRALDQGPEAERWMKELDAGEYWSFFESKLFAKQSA